MRTINNDTVRVAATPASRSANSPASSPSFAGMLERPPAQSPALRAIGEAAQREVATIQSQEATLDRLIAGNNTGSLDNGDLLRLQATMYSYSQRVDVATRVVDRAASGLRQLLTIQV
jgi:hypothetical protein